MNKIFYIFIIFSFLCFRACAFVEDEFVNATLKWKEIEKPKANLEYNYQNTKRIPIKMKILEPFKSEKELYEGQIIEFKTSEPVVYKRHILIPIDSIIKARVETIITNGMNGIPASVILGNFEAENIDSKHLTNYYEKFGFDLSLLVFPLKWALTPLPPTGSLTNFIKGGHAKIKKNKEIVIYYYPY